MDHSTLADQIDVLLINGGDPERAEREQAYLKSDLEHYGTPVPVIRPAVTRCARRFPDLDHHELVTTVETLWRDPVHERRMAAVELLMFRSALLEPHDMDLLERLLRGSRTWALVDNLASSVGSSRWRCRPRSARSGQGRTSHPTPRARPGRWSRSCRGCRTRTRSHWRRRSPGRGGHPFAWSSAHSSISRLRRGRPGESFAQHGSGH